MEEDILEKVSNMEIEDRIPFGELCITIYKEGGYTFDMFLKPNIDKETGEALMRRYADIVAAGSINMFYNGKMIKKGKYNNESDKCTK